MYQKITCIFGLEGLCRVRLLIAILFFRPGLSSTQRYKGWMSTQKGYFLKRLGSGCRTVAIVRSSAIIGVGMCYLPQQIVLLNSLF